MIAVSQRLSSYFAASRELRELTHKAQQLAMLQQHYLRTVPPTLAHASRVIGLEKCQLIIGADNSAIAAKLRQLGPRILELLQADGAEVTGILVRVQVAPPPATRDQAGHTLGEAGRRQVSEMTGTMPDSPLKRALQRLLGH
jgi:hypothetical protein